MHSTTFRVADFDDHEELPMKTSSTKTNYAALSVAVAALFATGSLQAADAAADHANHGAHSEASAIQGKGVVQSIDAAANTITLAHEPIPAINWPAMTMQFKVLGNAEELVKAGDTVLFDLQSAADSTITKIQKAE
jgi:Cu(I)/Ag(I) efflux system periplasmic protein CusF